MRATVGTGTTVGIGATVGRSRPGMVADGSVGAGESGIGTSGVKLGAVGNGLPVGSPAATEGATFRLGALLLKSSAALPA